MLKILDEAAIMALAQSALNRGASIEFAQKLCPLDPTEALFYYELRCRLADALTKLDRAQKQYWLLCILLNDPDYIEDMAEYHLEIRGLKADQLLEHMVADALGMRYELATEQDLANVAQLKTELLDHIIPATWPEYFPR